MSDHLMGSCMCPHGTWYRTILYRECEACDEDDEKRARKGAEWMVEALRSAQATTALDV